MGDPVAIISLVDVVFRWGSKIYDFFSALDNASAEIKSFVQELETFNAVLREVKEYINVFNTSTLAPPDDVNLDIVGVTLEQCNVEFRDIYDTIKDKNPHQYHSIFRKFKDSSSWVFDADERERSTQRLSRARETLALAMSTISRYAEILLACSCLFFRFHSYILPTWSRTDATKPAKHCHSKRGCLCALGYREDP